MSSETIQPQTVAPTAPATGQADSLPAAASTSTTLVLIAVAIIAILSGGVSVGVYHLVMAPKMIKLAVVDLPTVYREKETAFERALTKENATPAEREAALKIATDFARQLPKALDELAAECACTVLASNAVASRYNVTDLTQALRSKIGL